MTSEEIANLTREEKIKRLTEGCEAEHLFPGVLGNPVTFAARWGLPLSKSYIAHLGALNGQAAKANLASKKSTKAKRTPVPARDAAGKS